MSTPNPTPLRYLSQSRAVRRQYRHPRHISLNRPAGTVDRFGNDGLTGALLPTHGGGPNYETHPHISSAAGSGGAALDGLRAPRPGVLPPRADAALGCGAHGG